MGFGEEKEPDMVSIAQRPQYRRKTTWTSKHTTSRIDGYTQNTKNYQYTIP
jgi:hypothetical protein